MDKTVFIINDNGEPMEIGYSDLIWQFAEQTTTPRGVAPRYHVREYAWYKLEDGLYEKKTEANDVADDLERDTGVRPSIEEVNRFEGWTWGHQGNHPEQLCVFDSEDEANEWLFNGAKDDFLRSEHAPEIFNTLEEAKASLAEDLDSSLSFKPE